MWSYSDVLDIVTGRDLKDGQLEVQLAEDLDQELGEGCVGNGVENSPRRSQLWRPLSASLDRLGSDPASNSEGGEVSELDRFPTLSKPSTILILGTGTCPNSPPSASSPFPLSSAFPGALIILRNRLHQRHRPHGSRSHLNRPPSSQPSSLPELVTLTGSGGCSSFFLLAGLDFRLERSL